MQKTVLSCARMYHEFRWMQKPTFKYYDVGVARKLAKELGAKSIVAMAYNITKLGLVEKGNLIRSLKVSALKSDVDEIDRIKFRYNFYGAFLDVGTKKITAKHWRNEVLDPAWIEINSEFSKYYASLIEKEIADDAAKALDAEIKIKM